jgi:hypothetical protein
MGDTTDRLVELAREVVPILTCGPMPAWTGDGLDRIARDRAALRRKRAPTTHQLPTTTARQGARIQASNAPR